MTAESPRPLIGRVFAFAWSLASWVALTALASALLAALYYYHRMDDELRNHCQQRVSDHYQHLSVSLGSATLTDEGIRLRELMISKPSPTGMGRMELAYAHEILLQCEPTIKELLKGRVTIRAATVKGLTLHATREIDGSWNLAELLPFPRFNPKQLKLPTITIEDGTILYSDRSSPDRIVKFDEVDMTVQLKRLATEPDATSQPMLVAYDGTLATSFCRQIDVKGVANTSNGVWTTRGTVRQLDWSPELVTTLPVEIAGRLQSVGRLRADAEIDFDFTKPGHNLPVRYEVTGSLSEGKWQPAQLQQPITNLTADFHIDNQGCEIQKLSATMGDGHISSRLQIAGHNLKRPFSLSVTADQFPITRRLIETLPPSLQSMWQKFQPLGTVSGQVDLSFDGAAVSYDANITCHDVSLLHQTYQYPISNCRGNVRYRNSVLDFSLTGFAGSTAVSMSGLIRNPGPLQTGRWEFKTAGWKTIDDTLINALPPKARDLARKLQVRGRVGFWARFQRTQPSNDPPRPHLIIKLNEGWVNYKAFPYPVSDIRGTLEWKNGDWSFGNSPADEPLEGWNDGCRIVCRGNWWATRPDRPLELRFDTTNVSLDAELRRALTPGAQRIWTSLRPRGTLERLNVRLVKTDAAARPSLEILAIQRPAKRRGSNAPSSVEFLPTWFPYPLANVSGRVEWNDGRLIVRRLTAEHGRTTFHTNITGGVGNDGSWRINLTDFAFDNLRYDDQLAQALPKRFAAALNRAKLEGVFSAGGALNFSRKHATEPLEAGWNLLLQLERVRFTGGLPVNHLFGEVQLEGSSLGDQFSSRGLLSIDSMFCKNIQVTQLKGPIWIDSARIALGRRVPPRDPRSESPPISGSLYGGRIVGDAELLTGNNGAFTTRMQVSSANMSAVARDLRIGSGNLSGEAYAELILTGSTRGEHTLNGQGSVQLRNANMYELPLVLALLNRISSGKSDNTAFTNSDIAYRISDGYVYFDRFDLSGDAITLKGKGDMSLQRELNLDFYTIVGREQFWSPLVRPFLAEAGRQFLQIHVDGTLDQPVTRQEVLPGLNETLQELFPEQDPAAAQTSTEDKPPILSGRRLFFRRTQ